MRAGRLRTPLAIEQNTPTRDAAGGEIPAWTPFQAVWWCELVQVAGGEVYRNRVVHAQANHVATGRFVSGITEEMRATLGGRVFDIVAANNVENRDRELRLELLERLGG